MHTVISKATTGLLPRYDARGVQYKYTVAETAIDPAGTYGVSTYNSMGESTYESTDTDYPNEKYSLATANIYNSKPAEGMGITVHKTWIDAGDSMYRLPVNVELQYRADGAGWTKVASGTIDTTTDYVYIGVPKTVPEDSTGTNTWQDLYIAWITARKPSTGTGIFRVVETSLGSNRVVADGSVSTATNPEHESGWSFVSTDNQNYDVSPAATVNSDYDFTITNKRVGVEKIVLTKTWVDGNNTKDTRPASITFTVTADDQVFPDGSGGTTASKNFVMTPDENGNWILDTGWLQKYDYTTGAYITYSIAEKSLNYAEGKTIYSGQYTRSWSHNGKDLGYTIGPHHTGDIDTYALTNSLLGSVVPLMNKYWKDLGDTTAMRNRPDIYPVLLRSYTYTDAQNTSHTKYEKMSYTDRDWNTFVKKDNWWQCTFVAQPRYNPEGYEYAYYVAEEFSSVLRNDYVCSGGYTNAPDDTTGIFTEDPAKKDLLLAKDTGLTEDYYVARLNNDTGNSGTIVNKPIATRTVSGTKVWSNLPSSFNRTNLPDVTFQLYRYLEDGQQTQADAVPATTSDSTDIEATLKSGTNSFSFSKTVDRYNSEGIPYIYIAKESSPDTLGYTYKITNDTRSGLIVINDFKADQNFGVAFTKTWTGVPSGLSDAQKPSVTITLARYLTDGNGNAVDGTREADFATAAANSNANTITINSDITSEGWTDLAYYGPNGKPYQYRVEETNVPNGYTVYDAAGTNKVTATTINGATAYEAVVSGNYDTAAVSGSGNAGLTNKYGDVLGQLTVKKVWDGDSTYSVSPRSAVTFRLWRWTDSTAALPVQEGDNITLNGTESPAWQKTKDGLEIYAPNGEQYRYIVTEGENSIPGDLTGKSGTQVSGQVKTNSAAPTGYTVSDVTAPVVASPGNASAETVGITNKADTTSLNVTKAWQYTGSTIFVPTSAQLLFGAKISAIPSTITYRFQYSTDDGTSWAGLNGNDGNPVEKTISQAGDGSFGAASLIDLPTYTMATGVAKAAMYRAYEYSLTYTDGKTVTRADTDIPVGATNSGSIGDVTTAGTGATATNSNAAGTTATTNTIPVRKITITKNWDDEYNRDGVRPSSISFQIVRTGVETATDTQTESVTLTANDKKNDDNTWVADYYVPVYWNDNTTKMSSYTVTEDTTSDTSAVKKGYTVYAGTAENPTDKGSSVAVAGGMADAATCFRNSHAHGTYDITVAKKWNDGSATFDGSKNTVPVWFQAYLPASLTFRLQVSKDGTIWVDVDPTTADFNGVAVTKMAAVTASSGAITPVSWTGLPRYASDTVTTNLVTYHYRVREELATPQSSNFQEAAYSSENITAGGTVTVTNSLNVSKLAITKTWSDQDNNCDTRPDSVKYTVQYSTDGNNWATVSDSWTDSKTTDGVVTVTKAESYHAALDMLPKYMSDGVTKYQYRAVETALIYSNIEVAPGTQESDAKPYIVSSVNTSSDLDGVTTYTTAFTNTLVYASFNVTKKWVDSTPGIVSQVSGVRCYLQHSVDGINWTYVFGNDGNKDFWSIPMDGTVKTMNRLPKYSPDGKLYQYRAVEDLIIVGGKLVNANNISGTDPTSGTVGGFSYSSNTGSGAASSTITNTVATTSVASSKTWADNENANGTRPTSVTFHLLQNENGTDTDLGPTYYRTLTKDDAWKGPTWTDLPKKNAAGNPYTYTVTEVTVPGYTSAVTGDGSAANPYAVTNTAIPVSIFKVAADGTTRLAGAKFTLNGIFTNDTVEETKTWTSSATDAWNLTGFLVQGNVYTLTETVPPTGYTLPGITTTYLKVNNQGQLLTGTSATGTFTTTVTNNALAVKDTVNKVTITKKDAGGTTLTGAIFTITGTFADAADQTKKTPGDTVITTNANPFVLTGRLIAGNTYTVAETKAPDGYLTMQNSFTVTMGTDGHLTAGALPAGVNVTIGYDAAEGATIMVADEPTVLKASKYASTDTGKETPVAGAVFTVKPVGTATFSDATQGPLSFTSTNVQSNPGNLTAKLKTETDYTIQETTAPAGYQLPSPNPILTIHITNAGQLQESTDSGVNWTDVTGNEMVFEDKTTSVTLVKQDKERPAQIGGATYTLSGTFADGSGSKTLTSSASGAVAVTAQILADNMTEYTLTETTPAKGYKANVLTDSYSDATLNSSAMMLKMDTTGQLHYASSAAGGWTSVTNNALSFVDSKNVLTIKKVLSDGTTPAVATFDITPSNTTEQPDLYHFADGSKNTRIFYTDGTNGLYTFTGELVADNSYTIRELTPPAGYCGVSEFQITMKADGTISMADLNNISNPNESNNFTLTITDPQTHVLLTKTGTNGNLSGAVFTIQPNQGGKFVDGNSEMIWDTSENNAFNSTNFVAGQTYYFTETTAPAGYEKLPLVIFKNEYTANFAVKMGLQGGLTLLMPDGAATNPSYVTIVNTYGTNPSGPVRLTLAEK